MRFLYPNRLLSEYNSVNVARRRRYVPWFDMASIVNVREQGPSAEKLAFRQHSSDLIYAIGDPDVLSWKLYSNDLISANTRDEIVAKQTKQQKSSVLLAAVERKIKVDPSVFHGLVGLLREQDDPVLRREGERLQETYRKFKQTVIT